MANKWEYLVINLNEEYNNTDEDRKRIPQRQQATLNGFGKDGWELVVVTPTTGWDGQGVQTSSKAYLKREIV